MRTPFGTPTELATGVRLLISSGVVAPIRPDRVARFPVALYRYGFTPTTAFVIGAQYYLPIAGGKVWVAGTYAQVSSNNMLLLTPAASWGGVYKSARYYDANVFAALTPAVQLGLSFQATQQTYGDGSKPTNLRAELGMTFFF